MNPFSKKARLRRARKMRRLRPTKGEIIEALQTTDNTFGYGICLGPIIGWGYDVLSGIVRTVRGEEVHWGKPPPERPKYIRPSSRLIRNAPVLHGASEEMSEEDHYAFMVALNGATQALKPYIDEWHPLDQVDNFDNVLFQAPRPEHATTKFILAEVGIHEGQAIGWPGLDKELVGWEELWDYCQPIAAKRFMGFAVRNRNNYLGASGCQNGDEFAINMLLMLEGYETVEQEMEPQWKGYFDFLEAGCELIGCSSFYYSGCSDFFHKKHAIQIGEQYLIVGGCSKGHWKWKGPLSGHVIKCKTCDLYIGTQMTPPGFGHYVTHAWVVNEKEYFELLRRRVIR